MNRWIGMCAATLLSTVAVLEASAPEEHAPTSKDPRDAIARKLIDHEIVAPRKRAYVDRYRMSRMRIGNGERNTYRTETVAPPKVDDEYVTFRTYENLRGAAPASERLIAWGRVNTKSKIVELGLVHPFGVTWVPTTVVPKSARGVSLVR